MAATGLRKERLTSLRKLQCTPIAPASSSCLAGQTTTTQALSPPSREQQEITVSTSLSEDSSFIDRRMIDEPAIYINRAYPSHIQSIQCDIRYPS
jgi:hypothetical protein